MPLNIFFYTQPIFRGKVHFTKMLHALIECWFAFTVAVGQIASHCTIHFDHERLMIMLKTESILPQISIPKAIILDEPYKT